MCEPTSYTQPQLNTIFSALLLSETYEIVEHNNYILQVKRVIDLPANATAELAAFKDFVNATIGVVPCVAYKLDVGCVYYYLGVEEWTTDFLSKYQWD